MYPKPVLKSSNYTCETIDILHKWVNEKVKNFKPAVGCRKFGFYTGENNLST